MKLNRIFNQMIWVALIVLSVTFTACNNDDDESGAILLEAFGPSPALRGSKLTFIGRNLDRVTSVVLPDNIEIKDIEVVDNQHIKVVIPQNAVVGYVRLKGVGGVELVSKSQLSYTEPISISSISPSPVKPGDELTIEGEYLNLMKRVIFAKDVEVGADEFITHEREKIVVVVPREAQTGIITLADNATIPVELESEEELQVVLPSVESVQNLTDVKPGTQIKVTVKDIDLLTSVVLSDDTPVEFEINEDELSFTLPEGVTDGAISMIAPSGVKVAIANIGVAVPAELVVSPATDLKAGDVITVKGVNMELTTTVTFPGVETAVKPQSVTATEIKVLMPEMAVSGELVLNTASGNVSAPVVISTLKPEVQAYNPAPVAAGNEVVLQGKNLNLVASVTFSGDKTVEVTSTDADQLKVNVPVDAASGEVILTMKNSETVICASLEVTKPIFCYIPILPDTETKITAGSILPVEIENGDKLTNVRVNGNNTQYILQASTLYMLIPNNAGGKTTITLISSNGEISYTMDVVGSGTIETVVFEGAVDLGTSWGENVSLETSVFASLSAGAKVKIYFTPTGTAPQLKVMNGNWVAFPALGEVIPNEWGCVDFTPDDRDFTFSMDAAMLAICQTGAYGKGMIITGQQAIISKISVITTGGGASATETLWQGEQVMGGWSGSVQMDASLFVNAKVGKTLVVSIKDLEPSVTYWQVGLKKNTAGWPDLKMVDLAADATGHEFIIDDAMLAELTTNGLIISGCNYTLTKVELK